MRSLFWRIFFSLMTLIIALVLVTFAFDVMTHPGGPHPGLGFPLLRPHGPPQIVMRPPPPDGFPPGGDENGGPPPPGDGDGRSGNPPPMGGLSGGNGPGGPPPRSAADALRIYHDQGAQAVTSYFSQLQAQTGSRFYLFDQGLHPIAGGKPDQAVIDLAERAANSGHLEVSATPASVIHADVLQSQDGLFVLADATYPPPIDYRVATLRIISIVAIAALVCWWLTRQITQPILLLRRAAQDIAAGRFQTRVKPKLKGRGDELGTLAQDFDIMAQRLDTLMTAQNRLLADVSHELRSPLARLSVATALARRAGDAETCKTLDRVDREAERLNELISQLTLVSRLEIETASGASEEVDLVEVLYRVYDDAVYEANPNGKEVTSSFEVPSNQRVLISGNATLLRSAIENIVRNGVRYTAPGTTVEMSLKTEIRTKELWAVVTVRDHGPGVPSDELESIFKPFYRTAEARDRDSGGVGLGLAIAQRAVIRHGGSVTARNAVDGGLMVTMELPVMRASC